MSTKIKTATAIFIAVLWVAIANAAGPSQFKVGDLWYYPQGNTAMVMAETLYSTPHYSNLSGDIVIPKTVTNNGQTYTVNGIQQEAFYGCSGITSVTFPPTLYYLGDQAFAYCTGLTSITIPENITYFGGGEFFRCTGLTEVFWNVKSYSTERLSTFSGCSGIKSFVFGNKVEQIPASICSGLTALTDVTIPNSVTTIGNGAFSGCTALTGINIPNSVTSVGWQVFSNSGLTSITIPNSLKSMGYEAFSGCNALTSVNLPESFRYISRGMFSRCTALESITIPDSVTNISENAFNSCTALKSIHIGYSVSSLDYSILYNCNNLTSITVDPSNPHFDSRNNCNAIIKTETNTLIAGCKTTVIPNTVTAIGNSAFSSNTSLKSIEIPASVSTINDYAFAGCTALTNITCRSQRPPVAYENTFKDVDYATCIVSVPEGSAQLYWTALGWRNFTNIVESDDNIKPKCDVNGDGKVDIDDLNMVINAILNKE